jgi:NAD(P)-dependent dehydrogenase (short-subunit alcohol dehydrogenase family)
LVAFLLLWPKGANPVGYADELFDLGGKVVVVTGGSRGLGRQIAGACARLGADLVIASRKLDACVEAAAAIEADTGQKAMPYGLHVGRWGELVPFVDAVYDRFGRLDVLFNNAGMSPLYDALTSVSEQMFDSVVNLNFKGPFRLCALVGERMVAAGGGSIINVSSTGSIRSRAGIIPYAAAKAAMNSMTEGFSQAFGPSVRVNTLMSGTMFTDISKAWDMDAFNESITAIALARGGEPREIIGAAVYLASDASSYTTGATIRVDGGIP